VLGKLEKIWLLWQDTWMCWVYKSEPIWRLLQGPCRNNMSEATQHRGQRNHQPSCLDLVPLSRILFMGVDDAKQARGDKTRGLLIGGWGLWEGTGRGSG